jgi:poly-gamma-glutamate capsule biosynthesis protein CapA/YwtB (metallophosphatase superfamily)
MDGRTEHAPPPVEPWRLERRCQRRREVRRRRAVAGAVSLLVLTTVTVALVSGTGGELRAAVIGAGDRPAAAKPPVRTFDIVASGDLLIHAPVWQRAYQNGGGRYDFRPMFSAVRPLVRGAALALCHVETPMGAGGPSGYPIFNAPAELARAIAWTGWDACSTASNHAVDKGQYGVETTALALDAAGVRHTGSFRSRREARRPLILRVRGLDIALLSYTYGTNGMPAPHPWSVNLISRRQVVTDARRARRRGADFVIVNFHWGTEYSHSVTTQQRTLARSLLRRDVVDLIVGQHAHVVQTIRRVGGRFVVYGEGNLLSNQSSACCPADSQDGLIAVIHVRAVGETAKVTGVDYVPTRVRHPDYVVMPAGQRFLQLVRRGQRSSSEAQAMLASYRRTVGYVGKSRWIRPLPRAGELRRALAR